MSSDRNGHDSGKNTGKDATRKSGKSAGTGAREGDPRKRDQQDTRAAGSGSRHDGAKDDPSRAPESGTP